MLPIAILPVAGLLLGIGSSFTNETTIATYGLQKILGDGTVLHALLTIMNKVGSAVFDNLPLIFAVGVAIGMAKKEKEVAALSALIAYFVMNVAINGMLVVTGEITADGQIAKDVLEGTIASVCGIQSLQMGVFGGIIVGLGVAALHNRFHKIALPNALSFFGGSRFVPIISTIVYMFVGIGMYFVWPPVQNGIYALGGLVTGSGYAGTLIFGIIKRALIPFGLHHVFYMPFWQTGVGGSMEVAGQVVQGGQNIFFAQLADSANIAHFSADATRYFSGEFIFMIFGLPGAALAMYRCAKPEKRKAAGGLLLSAALACMLTGITEPLEFSFLFVAPALFVVQVILAGSAYMVAHMLNIAVGLTFSGGFLDFFLFGILQGNEKTSWMRVIPVGIIYFILYYAIFTFMIKKFNFKTPGREDEDAETKLYTKADVNAKKEGNQTTSNEAHMDPVSALITKGLGGKANISDVDCCATRLRITVEDAGKVNEDILKQSGSRGIVKKGQGVHPQVEKILVIGGGDGGVVRELAKYDTVEQIDVVEADPLLVEVCRKYFPQMACSLNDPRVHIYHEDGLRFIRSKSDAYDLIIIDSPNPFGAGEGLFTKEFYGNCFNALHEDGIMINQHESPFYKEEAFQCQRMHKRIVESFPISRIYQAHIPSYPSGHWLFGFASKRYHPIQDMDGIQWKLRGIQTKYYLPRLHEGVFALPAYVEELVQDVE